MKNRNYGIDLLRIIAMFFVVYPHVISHGGVLIGSLMSGIEGNVVISWLVVMIGISGLNCYALISGYVGYREEERPYPYTKFITAWLPVFFYCAVFTVIGCCAGWVDFSADRVLTAFTPVAHNSYWYFTAYVPVFFAVPYLNRLFVNLTDREMTKLAVTVLVMFSLFTTLAGLNAEIFSMENGLSFVWIFVLYIAGAWIKKCGIGLKVKMWKLWAGAAASIAVSMLLTLDVPAYASVCYYYYTPFYTAAGIFLVCAFSRLNPTGFLRKAIAVLAPAAFGVYLIHDNPIIREKFMINAFSGMAAEETVMMLLKTAGWSVLIFAGCMAVELVRLWLFRVCGIDSAVARLQKRLSAVGQKKDA